MLNPLSKKFVLSAAALLLSTTIEVDSALALTQSFDFKVTANQGPFNNQTFLGDFTFDDNLLTGVGSETLRGSEEIQVNFNFGTGYDFDEFDNAGGRTGENNALRLDFLDGKLIGLQYIVDNDFGVPSNNPLPDGILGFDIFVNPFDGERDFTYFNENFEFFDGGTIAFEQPTPIESAAKPPGSSRTFYLPGDSYSRYFGI